MEIIDEASGELIAEPGRPGKVLITNLTRLLMPIIRYPRATGRSGWKRMEPGSQIPPAGPFRGRARVGVVSLYYEDVHAVLAPYQTELTASGFQLLIRHHDRRTN